MRRGEEAKGDDCGSGSREMRTREPEVPPGYKREQWDGPWLIATAWWHGPGSNFDLFGRALPPESTGQGTPKPVLAGMRLGWVLS